jgi:hypothetical protein
MPAVGCRPSGKAIYLQKDCAGALDFACVCYFLCVVGESYSFKI